MSLAPPAIPFADVALWRGGPDGITLSILGGFAAIATLFLLGVVLLVMAWRRRK